jgi:hypothetical protein
VLTAPPSSTPPHHTAPGKKNFAARELAFAAALLVYAFVLGGALMSGMLMPDRSFWFLALPCISPMAWYGVAYYNQRGERDSGVLLSTVGWFLIALALIFKQIAVLKAGTDAYALQASSPFVPICATFGVLNLILGAVFSYLFWAAREGETTSRIGTHY